MTAVLASDCAGLWRRTLLIDADGSRDTGTDVTWLQGITAYVDTRGFAGTLSQTRQRLSSGTGRSTSSRRDRFPMPGRCIGSDGVLVETGVHADYVEHWVRDERRRDAVRGAVPGALPTANPVC